MKKYLIILLCLLSAGSVFGVADQIRPAFADHRKDSIDNAIIKKQDSIITVTNQIVIASKTPTKGLNLDSLQRKKEMLSIQINDLKKINTTAIGNEIQSTTLSIATLIFGCLLILLVFLFSTKETGSFDSYKLIGIMFIGTISVFLIPAGFDNTQITPVVGLLGTLAGYLVGTSKTNVNPQSPTIPNQNLNE